MRAGSWIAWVALAGITLALACGTPVVPEGTVDELRTLRDAAAVAGRVDEAVAISRAILDRESAAAGPTPTAAAREEVARAWFDLAQAQVAAYDRAAARDSYFEVIATLADAAPPVEPLDARAYSQLALLDRTHPDALAHASRALGILERRYDGKHVEIVSVRSAVADTLWVAQSIVDSHAELVRALRDARDLVGEDHAITADAYYRLALAKDALERFDEAEALYLASVGVVERLEAAGEAIDRERRAEIHEGLAAFYDRRRRKPEAAAQRAIAARYSAWTHKQLRTKSLDPVYPPRAFEKEIEGWVEVMYTISKSGRTRDVHVIEARPAGFFERAALWAVEHWRYEPALRDGVPAEQRSVRARIGFTRDD